MATILHTKDVQIHEVERWAFFLCIFNGVVSSIAVDLSLPGSCPDTSRPWLLIARVRMKRPNRGGLSSLEEGKAFDQWSERLIDTINAKLNATYVGRITGGEIWEFCFYAPGNQGLPDAISEGLEGWDGYRFNYAYKLDPEWSFYLDHLFPRHPKDQHQVLNYNAISKLIAAGDDGEIVRPVSHWCVMPDRARCKELEPAAAAKGLVLKSIHELFPESPAGVACEFELSQKVTLSIMNSVVLELIDLVASVGGRYDGWECRMERGVTRELSS